LWPSERLRAISAAAARPWYRSEKRIAGSAASSTIRPSARYCAHTSVNSSQICGMTNAERVRAGARAPRSRLQRQAVHHRGEHAHGIAGRPGDAPRRYLHAADHISAANHNGNFDTELLGGDQIAGNPVDGR